jgi:hypothetical protein
MVPASIPAVGGIPAPPADLENGASASISKSSLQILRSDWNAFVVGIR